MEGHTKTARKIGRVKELLLHFSRGQNQESRSLFFFGLSLLQNHTETLAVQGKVQYKMVISWSFLPTSFSQFNRHFKVKRSHDTKAPCQNVNDVVRQEKTLRSSKILIFFHFKVLRFRLSSTKVFPYYVTIKLQGAFPFPSLFSSAIGVNPSLFWLTVFVSARKMNQFINNLQSIASYLKDGRLGLPMHGPLTQCKLCRAYKRVL